MHRASKLQLMRQFIAAFGVHIAAYAVTHTSLTEIVSYPQRELDNPVNNPVDKCRFGKKSKTLAVAHFLTIFRC